MTASQTTSTRYLYRAEVKGIQAWILASDRLKELKGGSALIDELARSEGPCDARRLIDRTGGALQTAAAGNVEAIFEERAQLERFASAWPLIVAQRAPGLQVIQGWAPARAGAYDWDPVFKALGAARNHISPTLPELGPLVERAGRTGAGAVGRDEDGGLKDRAIVAKLEREARKDECDPLAPMGVEFIRDADRLGDGYLAVVHADGNGLGKLFMTFDANQRAEASTAVSTACVAAAKRAVAYLVGLQTDEDEERAPAGEGKLQLRARPIVVGGDDFTFLVDARFALPFTHHYLVAFAEESKKAKLFPNGLSACAGVAIVKTGFPFHAAHKLAESLCKAAKKRLRAEPGGGILFHRVTTASTELGWDKLEEVELAVAPVSTNSELKPPMNSTVEARLAGGPYNIQELRLLSTLAASARELPRGALREWLTLSHSSPERARALWRRTREVAQKKGRWKPFEDALNALGGERFAGWRPEDGWFISPPPEAGAEQLPARSPIADLLLWRTLQPDQFDRLTPNSARTSK
jgi:hypothetical protein